MKILFVIENYIPHIGGVEVLFKNLSEGLARLGNDVSIVTHRIKGTKEFEIINGVKIYRINCFSSRYLFSFLAIPKAIKLAKDADIIHTTTYNGALPAKIASMIRKKPCVITVHEILGKGWDAYEEMSILSRKIHKFLERRIIKLNFEKYIGVSESTKKQITSLGINTIKVIRIYNGIDYVFWDEKNYDAKRIRHKLKIKDSEFVYLFYGRPGISKGLEYLIKAVPAISDKIPDSKFIAIVSDDTAYKKRYDYLLKIIKKLDIEKNIILLKSMPYKELPDYIMAADCVVVPSLSEGFGFTAAESCALNKPVVASKTTSLPEVISGKHVFTIPKNPKSIAEGVIKIHNNEYDVTPERKFLWKNNINSHILLYNEIIRNNKRA